MPEQGTAACGHLFFPAEGELRVILKRGPGCDKGEGRRKVHDRLVAGLGPEGDRVQVSRRSAAPPQGAGSRSLPEEEAGLSLR